MKVYVAGSWFRKNQVGSLIKTIEEAGHTITHDWTKHEHEPGYDLWEKFAVADVKGVTDCDTLVVLMDDPNYAYRGTNCEIGVALGNSSRIIIYTPGFNPQIARETNHPVKNLPYFARNCFFWHPYIIHVCDEEELLQAIHKI